MASHTPIIIGVGDVRNKSLRVEDAHDPSELMYRALRFAIGDTGLSQASQDMLSTQIDSVSVVAPWTWTYSDLPGLLASKLKATPYHTHLSQHGGNQPAALCDEAARRVALGHAKVAVIAGGESLASGMVTHNTSGSC